MSRSTRRVSPSMPDTVTGFTSFRRRAGAGAPQLTAQPHEPNRRAAPHDLRSHPDERLGSDTEPVAAKEPPPEHELEDLHAQRSGQRNHAPRRGKHEQPDDRKHDEHRSEG